MSLSTRAHPLGNFSINHYNGLTFTTDGIDLLAVIDMAEIPTRQDLPAIDVDGDGQMGPDELAAAADRRCPQVAAALTTTVDGRPVVWDLGETQLVTIPGAAGLPTL